jgi:hypothetical protein
MLPQQSVSGQEHTSEQLHFSCNQLMILKLSHNFPARCSVPTKTDFFGDLSDSLTYWIQVASSSIADQAADLVWVNNEAAFKRLQNELKDKGLEEDVEIILRECMQGLAHSFLCILDGATKISEKERVYLVDSSNNKLGEGLHEDFVEYLSNQDQID